MVSMGLLVDMHGQPIPISNTQMSNVIEQYIANEWQELVVSRIKRERIVMRGGIDPLLIGTVFVRSDVTHRDVIANSHG